MNDVRFLFYTHENNQSLAELCLSHFFKHNKNSELKVTLLSNKFKNENKKFIDSVNYVSSEVDFHDQNRFVKTMIHGLSQIDEEFVFFTLDDYFFLKEIKYNDLEYVLNLMRCENIDYFGFDDIGGAPLSDFPKFESDCFNKFNENLYHRYRDYRYLFSVQPCIWKKESLIKLFERCDMISIHNLDETTDFIKENTLDFKSTMCTLKSLFDYNVVDENIDEYFVIAYTEIVRHGVFNLPENGMPVNPNEFCIKFTYNLINEENLIDNPDFSHLLFNYGKNEN